MDIRNLEIFVAVAELGSASRAAQALHVTQPAVSCALNKMERHYGVRFFDRSSHRMQLNQAGAAILPQAKKVLAGFSRFEGAVSQFRSEEHLTVGFSFGQDLLLSGCRAEVARANPDLEICPVYGNSARIRSSVADGTLDLGVFAVSRSPEELESMTLWTEKLRFVCRADHPLLHQPKPALQDLMQYPVCLREPGHFSRDTFDELCRNTHLQPMMREEGSYNKFLMDAVRDGNGFTLLSDSELNVFRGSSGLAAVTLSDVQPVQSVVLAWRKDRSLSPADRSLIRACRQRIQGAE